MARRVAVAWALLLLAAAVPAAAQTGSSGTSTAQNQSGTQTSSPATPTETGNDRRRRRSSATLGCGLCRPPRFFRTVSGRSAAIVAARTTSRASPTSATSPARSPSASGTGPRSSARSCSIRASTAICGRCSATIRTYGGIVDRYPRVNRGWTRRQRRRLLSRRQVQLLVGVPPAARGASRLRGMFKVPTGDDDSGRQHRKRRFHRRLHRQQGIRGARHRGVGLRRLGVPRQPGRLRDSGRGVPLGRRRGLPARAARCAERSS